MEVEHDFHPVFFGGEQQNFRKVGGGPGRPYVVVARAEPELIDHQSRIKHVSAHVGEGVRPAVGGGDVLLHPAVLPVAAVEPDKRRAFLVPVGIIPSFHIGSNQLRKRLAVDPVEPDLRRCAAVFVAGIGDNQPGGLVGGPEEQRHRPHLIRQRILVAAVHSAGDRISGLAGIADRHRISAVGVVRIIDLHQIRLPRLRNIDPVGEPARFVAVHVGEPADIAGFAIGAELFFDHPGLSAAHIVGFRGRAVDGLNQGLLNFAADGRFDRGGVDHCHRKFRQIKFFSVQQKIEIEDSGLRGGDRDLGPLESPGRDRNFHRFGDDAGSPVADLNRDFPVPGSAGRQFQYVFPALCDDSFIAEMLSGQMDAILQPFRRGFDDDFFHLFPAGKPAAFPDHQGVFSRFQEEAAENAAGDAVSLPVELVFHPGTVRCRNSIPPVLRNAELIEKCSENTIVGIFPPVTAEVARSFHQFPALRLSFEADEIGCPDFGGESRRRQADAKAGRQYATELHPSHKFFSRLDSNRVTTPRFSSHQASFCSRCHRDSALSAEGAP